MGFLPPPPPLRLLLLEMTLQLGFPGGTVLKNPPANAGDARDTGSISGSARSAGGGNVNPLQYSCLENPMDRGPLVGYSPWGFKELDMTEHACAVM